MQRLSLVALFQFGVAICVAACSSEPVGDTGKACRPGDVWPCTCADGTTGGRTCKDDGWAFSECNCQSKSRAGDQKAAAARAGAEASSSSAGRSAGAGGSMSMPVAGSGASAGSTAGRAAAGSGGSGGSAPRDPNVEFVTEPKDEAAYVFDQAKLRTYNILIAPADLAMIDRQPSAEVWVPAMLEFEGASYGPLKVRYKGSTGSFKAPCTTDGADDPKAGKCSIKLGFDEVDPELRFYGLKKLNFHAMNPDTSMLRDRLGYSLFRENNIAAPRAVHARILVNGQLEGLFIAVEQIDGRFTRARFTEGGEGNVYKEIWITMRNEKDVIASLESNTDAPNVAGMLEFQYSVDSGTDVIERFVDRAYIARYIAVDRVIVNDDGAFHFYCDPSTPQANGVNHNLYWYQAEDSPRFWLIPWDLDVAFDATEWVRVSPAWDAQGSCTCVKPSMYDAQLPASCDGMVKHFLAWRADYEKEVDKFIAGPFSEARVEAKLSAWIAQMKPVVVEAAGVRGAATEARWSESIARLRTSITSARANRGWKY